MQAKRTLPLFGAILLLAASLFVLDLLVPLGVAVWLPYVVVVLLSVWLPHRRYTYAMAGVCTVLTGLGLILSPSEEIGWRAATNRGLAVGAFWAAALAGVAARRAVELEKANAALQEEIARREKLEGQLLRTQRLESIGVMAGGIAHDFNNLLTPILMAAKLLKEDRPEEERRHLLSTLQASAQRGADLVGQLLSFAGGTDGRRAPVQLSQVVNEVKGIIAHTFPTAIDIRIVVADGLRPVLGDATQLTQVLMNLCVNARDAMPDGGTLTITANEVELDGTPRSVHPDARPGPYVRVGVQDTGAGMAGEVLDRAFDPFFTTKGPGKGTGLGLSTALGIVKSLGGFIQIDSEVGRGTRLDVFLPVHLADSVAPTPPPGTPPRGHGELVLVVDDEALILDTLRATLEKSGYRVLTAGGGEEALAEYARHRGEIAAVLVDLMMPGMDGSATLAALRRQDPHLRAITSSGLRPLGQADGAALTASSAFLPKPYTDEQLLTTLASVLRAS